MKYKIAIFIFLFTASFFPVERAYAVNCTVPAPSVSFVENRPPFGGGPIVNGQIIWRYVGRDTCRDIYNLRYGIIGGSEIQIEIRGHSCKPGAPCAFNVSLNRDKPYVFKVQACHTAFAQSSSCSQWGQTIYRRYGPDTCKDGFVWRELIPNDHVCVTPQTRQQGQNDNAQAMQRRNPAGGPYGPDTCKQGFVWRELTPNDHVCVTPQTRQQGRDDNAQAAQRRA
ncbi:hypothetical protein HB780_02380 (plasmid) [Rhizobium lusitanum]|uniref:hypothetical protein n=1 Tax=Rhizobium lusitanum TaxID=293958 RepID=UPI001619D817|nr:hypothetical protein [Rhizobium lusitanum]QND44652.1 hypothetical protein HB780_02380 [Rhizobium lusitanum]